MSALYPIIVAKQLTDAGIVGTRYIANNQLHLPGSAQTQELMTVVRNGLYQLFANQQPDGGFGYRQGDSAQYALSAYIYGALLQIEEVLPKAMDGFSDKRTLLETYLTTNGSSLPAEYLYYLRQRATHGQEVSTNEVRQLIVSSDLDRSTANVLGLSIATARGDQTRARELLTKIDRKTLGSGMQQEAYGYGVYIDTTILQAIYLRALLQRDPTHSEIKPLVQHLLTQRDEQGMRSRSTQRNVQVLLALGDYLHTLTAN